MITKVFGVTLDTLHKIKKAVEGAWEKYGDDDGPTCERIRQDGFWNDHIAVQAGIAVYLMKDPVTGLTHAERERLEMLAEEAAEVVQACTKILRHGYRSYHPSDVKNLNKVLLEKELRDLWVVHERMVFHGDLSRPNFYNTGEDWAKKQKWTHHQPQFTDPLNRKEEQER